MALTLTEAAKYTTNMVKRGVLEEIIKDSIILQKMAFKDVVGNALQYLREATLGTVLFRDPGEQWTEDQGTVTQKTAVIKILGGDADIDEFLKATRSDKNDIEAEVIAMKSKALKHTFLSTFYYGNSAATKEFDGLHTIFLGADMTNQYLHQGVAAAGAPLSIANLDLLLDKVLDGEPDCIISTRAIRRRLTQYLRANGALYAARPDEWGHLVTTYNDVRWYIDDMLTQTETIAANIYTAKTGGATSTLFCLRFGDQDLSGLQNGGISVKKLGQLEQFDAQRWRLKWYVGMALFRTISCAAIDGVTDAVVVA